MTSQPTLIPSLLALHPPTSLSLLLSRLSLQALHIHSYYIRDDIYTATTSVIPGQLRNLRLRAERKPSHKDKGKAKAVDLDVPDDGRVEKLDGNDCEYTLTYLSPPMNGREYSEMSVRACVGVEIVDGRSREDIESFVKVLGFELSHTYIRSGYLVHLPLPLPSSVPITIHLAITRIRPVSSSTGDKESDESTSEPYLLTLQPSRPIQAVSVRGDPGLEDMMRVMRDVADRIEGIQWETGRA